MWREWDIPPSRLIFLIPERSRSRSDNKTGPCVQGPVLSCLTGVWWGSGGILRRRFMSAQRDQNGNREGSSKKDDPHGAEEVLVHEHPGHRCPIEKGNNAPHVPARSAPSADPCLEHHRGQGDEKHRPGIHGGTLLSVAQWRQRVTPDSACASGSSW